jgi:hypothetical protein
METSTEPRWLKVMRDFRLVGHLFGIGNGMEREDAAGWQCIRAACCRGMRSWLGRLPGGAGEALRALTPEPRTPAPTRRVTPHGACYHAAPERAERQT